MTSSDESSDLGESPMRRTLALFLLSEMTWPRMNRFWCAGGSGEEGDEEEEEEEASAAAASPSSAEDDSGCCASKPEYGMNAFAPCFGRRVNRGNT
jgi:hypothetical protein